MAVKILRARGVRWVAGALALSTIAAIAFLLTRDQRMERKAPRGDAGWIAPYPTDELDRNVAGSVIQAAKAGKISLPHELARLRAQCPEPDPAEKCDAWVAEYLEGFEEPDRSELLRLFRTFRQFETEMTAFGAASAELRRLSPEEKYRYLKRKRREIFGADTAQLLYGLEEANVEYQRTIARFGTSEFSGKTPDERLRILEKERRRVFGDYYDTLKERETADTRMGLELLVRQSDMEKMQPQERDRITHALRVQYLGQEKADQIQGVEQNARRESDAKLAKLDAFLAGETAIQMDTSLSTEARLQKIEALRREIYKE